MVSVSELQFISSENFIDRFPFLFTFLGSASRENSIDSELEFILCKARQLADDVDSYRKEIVTAKDDLINVRRKLFLAFRSRFAVKFNF